MDSRWSDSALSRMIYFALLSLLFIGRSLNAQDSRSGQEALEKKQPTFKIPVNVITVNATVTDRQGNPVTDLTRNDFRIYDDGKLQTIQTFALEFYEPVPPADLALQQDEERIQADAAPSSARPRMISIFIDDITADSTDGYYHIVKAVENFLRQDIGPEDQVGIFAGSGRVRFPFSNNRQVLLEELATVFNQLNMDMVTREECPEITDLQAQMIVNHSPDDFAFSVAVEEVMGCLPVPRDPADPESARKFAEQFARAAASRQYEQSEYRSRTLLRTLRQHIRSLRHFEGVKNVVLLSDGFLFEDVVYELQDVVDQALYSGIIVNTVDSRGLYVNLPPIGSAGLSVYSVLQYKQRLYQENVSVQEIPLSQLAADTGGYFHRNSNDLYEGLRKISMRHTHSYVLTYAIPDMKSDGRYHRIRLEVSRPGLEITYRKGYYAPKEELTFERRKKEDILEALNAPGDLNEIPIGLAYNYYEEDDSIYSVSFMANASIRGLHFFDENSRYKNLISLVVAVFDEYDHFIEGLEKSIDFRLTEASYTSLLNNGFMARVEFKLPLGRYKIRAVIREGAQGKMGSVTKGIEIP